ncbi:MAG TPA: tRNA1(Val) (adenine(37)-N6)-methyltransferase [Lachnospiraceae bacterium]|nr:tRNA1(Val) (adenine(37)-N6)-methyltransferase [Lachnospiraceae bacterium]
MENQSSTTIKLKEHEHIDELNRNGYRIIQNEKTFCFGMDAVLLSGFAKVKEDETVLDIGTGTGIIPILLEAKTAGKHFTGIEIQEEIADMARRSVALNGLSHRIEIVTGDIKEAERLFAMSSFDVITTNPPYMIGSHGLKNEAESKAIARHEILCTLEDIVREGSRLLKPGGRFYMVHRPFRLVELFAVLTKYRLEPKRMRLVYPYADKEPNMVLIEALYGGRSRITVEKPLVVYKERGKYTDEIYDVYGY